MGEIILIILIILLLLINLCIYKMLDKRGLYFSLVINNILGFIMSFKIVSVFKMNINLGIFAIITGLSIIYIFITKYGYKENKNLLKLTLYSNISVALLLTVMNYFVPAITETISINMKGTFGYNYKILILYPIIILITQYIVIKLYKLIMSLQNNVSISIILTYIITGLIQTVLFYIIAYINILEIKYSLFLGISTYILGIPITILNLPLIKFLIKKKVISWII